MMFLYGYIAGILSLLAAQGIGHWLAYREYIETRFDHLGKEHDE